MAVTNYKYSGVTTPELASELERLQTYRSSILPRVRSAASEGVSFDSLDIPEEYKDLAAEDYQRASDSFLSNLITPLVDIAETGYDIVTSPIEKGVKPAIEVGKAVVADPRKAAALVAGGFIDEYQRIGEDPLSQLSERPLETALALLPMGSVAKLGKAKKLAGIADDAMKATDKFEDAKRAGRARDEAERLKRLREAESTPPTSSTVVTEVTETETVDPDWLPSGKKFKEAMEKARKKIQTEDSNKQETASKYSKVNKPKSSKWDTDKWEPGDDIDESLDIGEVPNYPDTETIDVENLSGVDIDPAILEELARREIEGSSTLDRVAVGAIDSDADRMLAAGGKRPPSRSAGDKPFIPSERKPVGTRAEPSILDKLKELVPVGKKVEKGNPPVDVETTEVPAEKPVIRGARTAKRPEFIDEDLPPSPEVQAERELQAALDEAERKLRSGLEADRAVARATKDRVLVAKKATEARKLAQEANKPGKSLDEIRDELSSQLEDELGVGALRRRPLADKTIDVEVETKSAKPRVLSEEEEIEKIARDFASAISPEITEFQKQLGVSPFEKAGTQATGLPGIDPSYFSELDKQVMKEMSLVPLENSRLGSGNFAEVRRVRDMSGKERAVKIMTGSGSGPGSTPGGLDVVMPGEIYIRTELEKIRPMLSQAGQEAVVESTGVIELGADKFGQKAAVLMPVLQPLVSRPDLLAAGLDDLFLELSQWAPDGLAVQRMGELAMTQDIPDDIWHLARGLDELANRGIIPQDIHAGNVMIDPRRPKGKSLTVVDPGNFAVPE